MKRDLGVIVLRIVAPLLVLAIGWSGFTVLASLREPPVPREPVEIVPSVTTTRVERLNDPTLDIEVDGVVVPHRRIEVAAEVSGRVSEKAVGCRAGRFVTTGTLLFELDDTEYQLELSRLEQEKKQAENSRLENLAEIENTRKIVELRRRELKLQDAEVARVQELLRSRATNASALDQAEQARLVVENALVTAQNQLRLLEQRSATLGSAIDLTEEKIRRARLDVDRTQVRAPIDGIIATDHVEQDSFVQRGTVLVTIEDTSAVEVRCQLRMEELYWFWHRSGAAAEASPSPAVEPAAGASQATEAFGEARSAARATASLAASPAAAGNLNRHYELPEHRADVFYELAGMDYMWRGRLARYEGIGLDEKTRTVPCRIVVDNPRDVRSCASDTPADSLAAGTHPPALVRGMYVRVTLHAQPDVVLLELPESAVRPGNVVWRVDAENRLRRCEVRIAAIKDGKAILHADGTQLNEGDRVVTSTLSTEMEGTVVTEEQPAS